MKILLVDDDAFLRDMYATKFTECGDEVKTAQHAADALRILGEDQRFDVILLDMIMPGMTGVELVTTIRGQAELEHVRCIVLSNQGQDEDVREAMAAGAIGYIVKAESIPSEVVDRVHDLLKAK